jgi:hypothetical protein
MPAVAPYTSDLMYDSKRTAQNTNFFYTFYALSLFSRFPLQSISLGIATVLH